MVNDLSPRVEVARWGVLSQGDSVPTQFAHVRSRADILILTRSELNASKGNVHLQRAILRSLQKPLSVLLTNLSTQLLPLLSSPLFLNPPAPTVANPNLNATQTHALAVANFAGELLDVLDELDLGRVHDARGDGLNNLRDGLVSLIGRVVNPLVAGLKNEITPILQALEEPAQPTSITSIVAKTPGAKFVTQQHPSIMTLQALMPAFSKALTRYTVSSCCQTTLATLLISIVWRAIISLAYRPTPPRSRANSATSSVAASAATRKRLGTSTTPPTTPPASRFTMKLPSSRPPSPISVVTPTTAADARVVYDLLSTLPKPSPSNDVNKVAREAVDEAFEALAALGALLAAIENQEGPDVREDFDLELLTDGLPVLIALPVLLRWAGHGEPHVIPTMIGIAESEYRESCLSGFGRAEECASVVIQRMLDVLGSEESTDDARSWILVQFLESNKDGSD